jgi:hypothetical protein
MQVELQRSQEQVHIFCFNHLNYCEFCVSSVQGIEFSQSVCLFRISYKTNVISLNSNGRLDYVMRQCVSFEVVTGIL